MTKGTLVTDNRGKTYKVVEIKRGGFVYGVRRYGSLFAKRMEFIDLEKNLRPAATQEQPR